MIRAISAGSRNFACVCIVAFAASVSLSEAATFAKPSAKSAPTRTAPASSASKPGAPSDQKTNAKAPGGSTNAAAAAKPQLVGSFGDWGAYAAKTGGGKTCYALAQPKDRQPGDLKRDPAYIFISERPAENVHDEISIIMGF
ncbi:MAG TPA: hypothetical protein VG271_02755, partial [Beijerinckiaceae bacterium]|nr:hypothetical protein [Beijerinckiaceae bacterium]